MQRSRSRFACRAAALLLAGALAACSDAGAPTAAPEQDDPLIERLIAMGAQREDIVDRGDHFVVEGDIQVFKRDLRAAQPRDGRAHAGDPMYQRYNGTVAWNRRTVRVDLAAVDAENASWAAATRAAMSNWNNAPGTTLSYVEGSPADVTVSFVSTLGSCTVAQGAWPSSGAPGSTVQISRVYAGSYTYAKQVWIMTHELGHNIGLAHTDQTFGTLVPGTPTSDGASVMNSGSTYGGCPPAAPDWSSLSGHDQTAVCYLYGDPNTANLTAAPSSGTVLLSWSANPCAVKYQIRYMERYRDENMYEGTYSEEVYTGSWGDVYGTSLGTGAAWTGVSQCIWYQSMYEEQVTDYWYEVRPVFASGNGGIATVGTNSATC